MSIPIQPKLASGKRFGLAHDAIFRLWKSTLKDDDTLIDEAIAGTYDRMISIDPVRAEKVMSLTIRRHADAKNALKDLLSQGRQQSCDNYNKPSVIEEIYRNDDALETTGAMFGGSGPVKGPPGGTRHEYTDTAKACLGKTVWIGPRRNIPPLEVDTQRR